jgi:hypothetical protein
MYGIDRIGPREMPIVAPPVPAVQRAGERRDPPPNRRGKKAPKKEQGPVFPLPPPEDDADGLPHVDIRA